MYKKYLLVVIMLLLSAPETAVDGEIQLAPELSVYNWADYIDEQVLADYEERYGVKIIYDTYASNEDLLTKLQAGASGYDVIFPSESSRPTTWWRR